MLNNYVTVPAKGNRHIKLNIYPGHYATSHAHVDNYFSMADIRTNCAMAEEAAREIAKQFRYTPVDTVISLEYTQIISAFVAKELSSSGRDINSGADIHVVTPQINSNNQLMFPSDMQPFVTDKNVLLILSTVSTGRSLARAAECVRYYGGKLAGIGAIFSAIEESGGMPIQSIFHRSDLAAYNSWRSDECPMCKAGRKIDGLVTTGGYTKI
ncbi:MAG: orotate phosphoribosyltransferase [Clostridia bacterium]|jgi:orotate phosphoribosyltransferase|nr:orotate phosphoribosyltransferase [Clostridia bacterium]MBQ4349763.1 orotate phosphoribosyltransferase [Clostridia bacterium]